MTVPSFLSLVSWHNYAGTDALNMALDSHFVDELGIQLNELPYEVAGKQFVGYWSASLSGFDEQAIVEEHWRRAHALDIRIFVGNTNVRSKFVGDSPGGPFGSLIYLLPGVPVLDLVQLTDAGLAYHALGQNAVQRVTEELQKVFTIQPFEIIVADETYLLACLVTPVTSKATARAIEKIIMSFAPFSGDPENNVLLSEMIRESGKFNVRLRTL